MRKGILGFILTLAVAALCIFGWSCFTPSQEPGVQVMEGGRDVSATRAQKMWTSTDGKEFHLGTLAKLYGESGSVIEIKSGGTFQLDSGATLNTSSGSLLLQSADITLDDGTGASPSLTFTDGTDETAAFQKADARWLGLTTDATDGLNIITGNLKVGNGTPSVSLDGEDFYCEGTSEFAGAMTSTSTTQWNGSVSGGIKVAPIATGTGVATIQNQNVADATFTLPSATCTFAGLGLANTWSATNTFNNALVTAAGVGSAGTGVSAVENGDGVFHKTTLTCTAVSVTLADGAHGGGQLLYTFPEGVVKILGTTLDGAVTNTAAFNASTADTFSFALGQVVGADDDDLTSTEASIFAKVTEDTDSGGTLTRASDGYFATDLAVDGHTAAATVYANFAVAAANNTDANDFGLTGTVTITWVNLGDY